MEKGKLLLPILVLVLTLVVSGCGKQPVSESPTGESESAEAFVSEQIDDSTSEEQAASETESVNEPSANEDEATQEDTREDIEAMLQMRIGDTAVTVEWEDNESLQALRDLCTDNPLTIKMSMYGGFEQVYGSNSWAYTRLGHITDQNAAGMSELLGNGDVTITISME